MGPTHIGVGWAEWMEVKGHEGLYRSEKRAITPIKPGAREKRKIKVLGLMERYGEKTGYENNVVRGSIKLYVATR